MNKRSQLGIVVKAIPIIVVGLILLYLLFGSGNIGDRVKNLASGIGIKNQVVLPDDPKYEVPLEVKHNFDAIKESLNFLYKTKDYDCVLDISQKLQVMSDGYKLHFFKTTDKILYDVLLDVKGVEKPVYTEELGVKSVCIVNSEEFKKKYLDNVNQNRNVFTAMTEFSIPGQVYADTITKTDFLSTVIFKPDKDNFCFILFHDYLFKDYGTNTFNSGYKSKIVGGINPPLCSNSPGLLTLSYPFKTVDGDFYTVNIKISLFNKHKKLNDFFDSNKYLVLDDFMKIILGKTKQEIDSLNEKQFLDIVTSRLVADGLEEYKDLVVSVSIALDHMAGESYYLLDSSDFYSNFGKELSSKDKALAYQYYAKAIEFLEEYFKVNKMPNGELYLKIGELYEERFKISNANFDYSEAIKYYKTIVSLNLVNKDVAQQHITNLERGGIK